MTLVISVETPLQDEIRHLVAELNAYMIPLTPREFQFQLTVEQMAEPTVTLFVARDETGRAVGMGALKEHGEGLGEVKRMYTLPEVRGQRVGAAILKRIEDRLSFRGHADLRGVALQAPDARCEVEGAFLLVHVTTAHIERDAVAVPVEHQRGIRAG